MAAVGLGMLDVPAWVLPALAQGETLVPFTDIPDNFPAGTGERRILDVRKINGPYTPADQFYTVQHFGHPVVDPAAFRLKVTGLVNRTMSLTLEDIKRVGNRELVAGWECSGNRRPLQGLCSSGRWTGVPVR